MPSSESVERKPDYSRLTRAELASLFALHRAGKNQVEIAHTLGCNVSTVSRWLSDLTDTTDLAKQTARNAAQKLVERVIKHANVEESLEVLDRIEVLPKRQSEGKGAAVNIVIGMPGSPAGPDPLVVSLSPVNSQQLTE